MTESTKTVFEKYQVRKTKKQKSGFIGYVSEYAESLGYEHKVEKGSFGARNIVVGDPEKAKVVYTAHYDTCPVLPFPNFITPKNIWIYLLYNIVLVLAFFVVSFGIGFAVGFAGSFLGMEPDIMSFVALIIYFALLFLMMLGPANKHTANDNTSGVTTLLDLMAAMPEEARSQAAFIFFDLEESGLFGSKGYFTKHKVEMKERLLVNFDCVSDGENILFVLRKGAVKYAQTFGEAYVSDENCKVSVETKGVFYPSDQACFPCGVGVAALKKTKRGLLYMDKIHTKRDTVYREENIDFLVKGSVKLTEMMSEK